MTRLTAAFVLLVLLPKPTAPDVPSLVVRELAALRDTTTLAAWLRTRGGESVQAFDRAQVQLNDDHWCARAERRTTVGAYMVERYAYFYPPEPTPDLSLPVAQEPGLIRGQCRLGLIWLETSVTDSMNGLAVARGVRDALTQAYGPVHPAAATWMLARLRQDTSSRMEALRLGLMFQGSAFWRVPGRWENGSAVIFSAYDRGGLRILKPRSLAAAFLPFAGLRGPFNTINEWRETDRKVSAASAAQAARLSGLDFALTTQLLAALASAQAAFRTESAGPARARRRLAEGRLNSALSDWLAASQRLDATHRAAALLAADQVLGSEAASHVLGEDSAAPSRQALGRLGARFEPNHLGGGENYVHSWLDEALRLDPTGPGGRLATIALLRMGFDMNGMCAGTDSASQRVNITAERLLQSSKDPAEAAELHLLAGDGYADIVALASGAGDNYAETTAYAAAAPRARLRAIDHYRQGIALAARSEKASTSWLTAWRLLAGLPPTGTHFFCVYD